VADRYNERLAMVLACEQRDLGKVRALPMEKLWFADESDVLCWKSPKLGGAH
jgi:hypothetical protein